MLDELQARNLEDMEYIYWKSYKELRIVFEN